MLPVGWWIYYCSFIWCWCCCNVAFAYNWMTHVAEESWWSKQAGRHMGRRIKSEPCKLCAAFNRRSDCKFTHRTEWKRVQKIHLPKSLKRTHSQHTKKPTTTITNANNNNGVEKYANHQCKLNACSLTLSIFRIKFGGNGIPEHSNNFDVCVGRRRWGTGDGGGVAHDRRRTTRQMRSIWHWIFVRVCIDSIIICYCIQ